MRASNSENWQVITSEVRESAARLMRGIRKGPYSPPTLLKWDGTFTDNSEQTISTLMDVHFPESTDIDIDELINNSDDFSQPGDNHNDDLDWIRRDLVYSVASSFFDFKANGPNEIKPVMIKHLLQVAIDILTNI